MFSWFDRLSSVQITLVFMATEILIGAVIGLSSKLVARMQVSGSEFQIVPARTYESPKFGRDFPKHAFDLLSLPTEFVVVESLEGKVVKERFYTVFGSFCEAFYRDGQFRGCGYSALGSPLYCCMVVLPCITGFFGSVLLPIYGDVMNPLLYSGILWMVLTFSFDFTRNYRRENAE